MRTPARSRTSLSGWPDNAAAMVRRADGRAGSTKKRSAEDDAKFEETYLRVLDAAL